MKFNLEDLGATHLAVATQPHTKAMPAAKTHTQTFKHTQLCIEIYQPCDKALQKQLTHYQLH